LLNCFNQTIYVHIEKDAFSLFHVQKGTKFHIASPTPFSNARLAVAHFEHAESVLKKGLEKIYPPSPFRIRPVLVMHQMHLAEGGLCDVEKRILTELALSAGGRNAYVWEGETLSKGQLVDKVYA